MEMKGGEWREWAQHPKTRDFCKLLQESVREHQQGWLNRAYEADDHFRWAVINAAALASAGFAQQLILDINEAGEQGNV